MTTTLQDYFDKGYRFKEATEKLVGRVSAIDRVLGRARMPWNCAGARCLCRIYPDIEYVQIWKTRSYVVYRSTKTIVRYVNSSDTTTQIYQYDKTNGKRFPAGFEFVLLPVKRTATLAHAKKMREHYRSGGGNGTRHRPGRKVQKVLDADIRNWGGNFQLGGVDG